MDSINLLYKNPIKFLRITLNKLSFIEKLFSVKNNIKSCHKIVTILGLQLKFKSKKLREKKRITDLENEIKNIKNNYSHRFNKIEKYFKSLDITHGIVSFNNDDKLNFKTFQSLTNTIRKQIQILPSDIDLVVGIPRSGIIPAYIIALFLNKQVCSLNEFINGINPLHGERKILGYQNKEKKKILVVDDSIFSGNALKKTKEILKAIDNTQYEIEYCCIYARANVTDLVDYTFEIVSSPRMFQWNYLNHSNANISCYDMDGVLCVDPTNEQNDDGEKYIDFIKNAKPLYIPTTKINSIVTSRLEKYRNETELWLKEHNVEYDNLYMLDVNSAEERRQLGCHASFKAKIFSQLENCKYFIESERIQAKQIAELSGKTCICVTTDECFNGNEIKEVID